MTYLFSKKKDDLLIEMVRANAILYDPYNDNFRNLIMKHQVWENISGSLGIPLLDVKKRWRHFRDHYLKKLKLTEAGRMYGKPWEHMQRLEFLAHSRAHRREPEEAGGSGEEEPRVVYMLPAASSEDDEPGAKRRRSRSPAPPAPEDEPEPGPAAPDPARAAIYKFFESMAGIVAQFPPRRAAEARLRVCQLITEMEIEPHHDRLAWQDADSDLLVKREQ